MAPLTIVVSAFMLALVAMSFAFAGGAVPVAIPIAVLVIGLVLWMDHRRQRDEPESLATKRRRAKANKVEFTDRDKETLYSE